MNSLVGVFREAEVAFSSSTPGPYSFVHLSCFNENKFNNFIFCFVLCVKAMRFY